MNSIAFWRRMRGKTQLDIEAETGINQSVLSEVENDMRPADIYLSAISKALTVTEQQLMEPPPLVVGQGGDIVIDRTANHPAPGKINEEGEGKRRSSRKLAGRVFFLTPSQARVSIRRNRSVEITDGIWDGAQVMVEVPCEPDHQSILLAKAEAARLADEFLREEMAKIENEYIERFKQGESDFNGESHGD